MAEKAATTGREIWLDGLRGTAALIVAFFHLTTGSLAMPYRSFWVSLQKILSSLPGHFR